MTATPHYQDDHVTLHHGDCRDVLAAMPDASVDAVVTDPPYELAFMGKGWDSSGIAFDVAMWAEVLRVLKPGGHLLAFGGTRTFHRVTVAIEDAGFEIRDDLGWSHMKHVFCQCGPVQYDHENVSRQGVHDLREGVDPGGQVPGSTEHDVRTGVRSEGERASASGQTEREAPQPGGLGLHGVRGDLRAASEPRESGAGADMQQAVQRGEQGEGSAALRLQGRAGSVATGVGGVLPTEDDRPEQPSMEGRRDVLAEGGQLPGDQVRPSAGMGATDGPQGRVHHGASACDGDDGGASTDPSRGGAPCGPRSDEQRPGQPGAVPVEWIAQGGGAWPACPRCHEPLAPPFAAGPLAWNYGSGFPKSLDVSKAIDKAAGAQREVVGTKVGMPGYSLTDGNGDHRTYSQGLGNTGSGSAECAITAPATPDAERWNGWGTALKPAWEPIIVARKPLTGTVAANVLEHGTGALNIDGCRIGMGDEYDPTKIQRQSAASAGMAGIGESGFAPDHAQPTYNAAGRWPANVVLDEEAAALLDAQSGVMTSTPGTTPALGRSGDTSAPFAVRKAGDGVFGYGDRGGASRFFYVAKAPTHERPKVDGKAHATVKPLTLIRWLVRLVTPPGGHVLDPFAGSGTTAEACIVEGYTCTLIEKDTDHLPLIVARLAKPIAPVLFGGAS